MKRYSTLLFSVKEQGLETRKLRKLLAKEEEEEEVQRDSKVVKEYLKCYWNASQGLAFIDSSCLVKKNHWKSYNLEKNLKTIGRVTSFDFYSKLVTGNRLAKPCNRLHKAFLWKDVTLYNWIWISTFRYIGNRLPIYCNRLHHLKNNWNIAKSVKRFWNQTLPLVIDYMKLVID